MRVISGSAKGMPLRAPGTTQVRPMTDRAKEALFAHLSDRVRQATVLDLFAGSGSLAIEALSRGATSAFLVDSSAKALKVAEQNVSRCGFEGKVRLAKDDALHFVRTLDPSISFDLVFVDPPYSLSDNKVVKILEALVPHLSKGAAVCLHREKARLTRRSGSSTKGLQKTAQDVGFERYLLGWPPAYRVVFERSYGGSIVSVGELVGERR